VGSNFGAVVVTINYLAFRKLRNAAAGQAKLANGSVLLVVGGFPFFIIDFLLSLVHRGR